MRKLSLQRLGNHSSNKPDFKLRLWEHRNNALVLGEPYSTPAPKAHRISPPLLYSTSQNGLKIKR